MAADGVVKAATAADMLAVVWYYSRKLMVVVEGGFGI